MGKPKVNRTKEMQEQMASQVFIQEVPELLFGGCKVLVAVPAITGIDPAELAMAYKYKMNELQARAAQPSPREMMDMSIKGLPSMIKSALEN